MRYASLHVVGYTGPVQLSIPVPDGRTLAVGQALSLPGCGHAIIESVLDEDGELRATAQVLERHGEALGER
ncbi:MAG: hypothetical protein AAGD10_10620 [Myxococcota bacterium]